MSIFKSFTIYMLWRLAPSSKNQKFDGGNQKLLKFQEFSRYDELEKLNALAV